MPYDWKRTRQLDKVMASWAPLDECGSSHEWRQCCVVCSARAGRRAGQPASRPTSGLACMHMG